MPNTTTVGNILLNEALPEDMRKEEYRLDKKGVHQLFQELAEKHPDQYKDVLKKLSDIGRTAVWTEGVSVSLAALRRSQAKERVLAPIRGKLQAIIDDDKLSDEDRRQAIIDTLLPVAEVLPEALLEEARQEGSPYALQIDSGARGKKGDLSSLRGADLLATDQQDRFIPVPLLNSYAEGFTPAQYFAASYGQRKGQLDVKMATADAGFLNKQLVNAAHRQVVTKEQPDAARLPLGLPTSVTDKDNIGAALAMPVGKYEEGTILTDAILEDLQDDGVEDILVHSPMTEMSDDGGISALAAGRRTRQGLHQVGDNIGIPAAQALGERLSQGALSSKHSAGVGTRISKAGFEYINRLIQSPENFPEAGPLVEDDGLVKDIRKAPQGGHYIDVGERTYYAAPDLEVTVKVGDQLEQGDDLTDGTPHPSDLVRLRGMGEARRVYLQNLKEALDNSGVGAHRRNVESVVAGLLNWAQVTSPDGIGDNIYGDVVPYNRLIYNYQPRASSTEAPPGRAVGMYLEEPVLHYTPGTRITKKVADELNKWKIKGVFVNPEAPEFEPHMVRGLHSVYHDPDWKTRMAGFYTASAFNKSLHRGLESDTKSTSFVPSLGQGTGLGKSLETQGKYGAWTSPVNEQIHAEKHGPEYGGPEGYAKAEEAAHEQIPFASEKQCDTDEEGNTRCAFKHQLPDGSVHVVSETGRTITLYHPERSKSLLSSKLKTLGKPRPSR